MERVFRLRLAAPNDTICLSRAYAFRSYVCRSGVGSAGAVFYLSKFIWHKIVRQSRYNMSSYYNGGAPMINKQYNPINWTDCDPHNETCMDTNDSYFTAELPEDERQLYGSTETVDINRTI